MNSRSGIFWQQRTKLPIFEGRIVDFCDGSDLLGVSQKAQNRRKKAQKATEVLWFPLCLFVIPGGPGRRRAPFWKHRVGLNSRAPSSHFQHPGEPAVTSTAQGHHRHARTVRVRGDSMRPCTT